jgi:hypothetical protein
MHMNGLATINSTSQQKDAELWAVKRVRHGKPLRSGLETQCAASALVPNDFELSILLIDEHFDETMFRLEGDAVASR